MRLGKCLLLFHARGFSLVECPLLFSYLLGVRCLCLFLGGLCLGGLCLGVGACLCL